MVYLAALCVLVALFFFVSPAIAENLLSKIRRKAGEYLLDPALVWAIAKTESNFDPRAKNPADPSYGLMQITPPLAFDYGVVSDPYFPTDEDIERLYDPDISLDIACRFLKYLTSKYPKDQAIQMYNVGERGYNVLGRRNSVYLDRVKKGMAEYMEKYG